MSYDVKAKKLIIVLLFILLTGVNTGPVRAESMGSSAHNLPYWTDGSPSLASVQAYVNAAADPESEDYIDPSRRIAVFDFDGTLYGERFPTYFDTCLFLHRALHE